MEFIQECKDYSDTVGTCGILRKGSTTSNTSSRSTRSTIVTQKEMRQVDLLVFGYACKVFRDDIKALEIDQGKHLIPWMGDTNLKIDRYDVRGALCDLSPYEPPPGGYRNRLDYLSSEEQRAEQLCEEERYLFLCNNEMDYITRQEEELKRLQQETHGLSYSQVGHSYDHPQLPAHGNNDIKSNMLSNASSVSSMSEYDIEQQPFQMLNDFIVPDGIHLPKTMKQHVIIEKTARFIASQGVQMEILLKAKQSNNVQFDFLTQNNYLNPYYKCIVEAIKNGKYPEKNVSKFQIELNENTTDNFNNVNNNVSNDMDSCTVPEITVPTVRYKPSADCAYTQLISRIKGVSVPELQEENSKQDNRDNNCNSPTVPLNDSVKEAHVIKVEQKNDGYSQSIEVEVLKNTSALALAQNYNSDSDSEENCNMAKDTVLIGSKLNIPIPNESLKNIIDKTALYVVKNGRKFEETLLTKSEERFTFLLPDNEYYPYYLYKITGDPNAASKEQNQRKAAAVAVALLSKKGITVEKNCSPLSFSIKTKDDTNESSVCQLVLPQDHSDEDETNVNNESVCTDVGVPKKCVYVPEQVQKAIEFVETQLMVRNAKLAAFSTSLITSPEDLQQPQQMQQEQRQQQTQSHLQIQKQSTAAVTSTSSTSSNSLLKITVSSNGTTCNDSQPIVGNTQRNNKASMSLAKLEAERNALYEQQQQNRHKEMKKAEEKIKDKLAQRAREKLGGLISKEKQLQFERKRKAIVFLNQIKGVNCNEGSKDCEQSKQNDDNMEGEDDKDKEDSDNSVHSIPITSFGPPDDSSDERHQRQKQQQNIGNFLPMDNETNSKTVSMDNVYNFHCDAYLHQPNTIVEKKLLNKCTTTITVSDDEDELTSETKQKRCGSALRRDVPSLEYEHLRFIETNGKQSYNKRYISCSSLNESLVSSRENRKRHSSKSRSSNKTKKSKTKKSSKNKKKSKKRARSRSRSRSRSYTYRKHNHVHRHYNEARHGISKDRSYSRNNSSSLSPSHASHQIYHQEYEQYQYYHKSKQSSKTPYRSTHTSKDYKRQRYD